jgi:hypothetical protein
MGLVFMDGLDSYGATADLVNSANWSSVPSGWTWNATAGRRGGGAIVGAPTAGTPSIVTATNVFSFGVTVLKGIGFWMKLTAAPAALRFICATSGSNGIGVVATSGLICYIGSNSQVHTGNVKIADGNWHWVEYRTLDQNGQNVSYWCDNVQQLLNTGLGQAAVACASINFPTQAAGEGTLTIDDPFVCDANAPNPNANNLPMYSSVISPVRPGADGTVIFAPNSGSNNYSRINETAFDDDSSYVQSSTSGDVDAYDYAALGYVPAAIQSVQVITRCKNAGSGTVNMKNRCVSGGTTSDGASVATTTSYKPVRTVYNQNPNGSVAWTQPTLDAATFGFTVV